MTVTDPIADFLTRIRNALKAQHRYVDIPFSNFKKDLAEILKKEYLIESYKTIDNVPGGTIRVYLKYSRGREPVIKGLKRVSRPGLRKYVNHTQIPQFFGGLGIPIISTSRGVMSGKSAKEMKVGGELVCLVW